MTWGLRNYRQNNGLCHRSFPPLHCFERFLPHPLVCERHRHDFRNSCTCDSLHHTITSYTPTTLRSSIPSRKTITRTLNYHIKTRAAIGGGRGGLQGYKAETRTNTKAHDQFLFIAVASFYIILVIVLFSWLCCNRGDMTFAQVSLPTKLSETILTSFSNLTKQKHNLLS